MSIDTDDGINCLIIFSVLLYVPMADPTAEGATDLPRKTQQKLPQRKRNDKSCSRARGLPLLQIRYSSCRSTFFFFSFFLRNFSYFWKYAMTKNDQPLDEGFLKVSIILITVCVCQYCVQNLLARESESSVNILSNFCLVRCIIRVNGKDL